MNSAWWIWRTFALLALLDQCSALEARIPSLDALARFIDKDNVPQPGEND